MSEYKVAIKNLCISFIINFVSLVISFVSIYLINQYLGTSNYGLLNIALAIVPYVTLISSSLDTLTVYRLYEPLSKNNFELANRLMQRSLYEYRTRGIISFVGLLVLSVFFPLFMNVSNMINGISVDFTDSLINSLIILAAGVSSLFAFLISPIYQRILVVERKGYILQILDVVGKVVFNGIFLTILITNHKIGYITNNRWLLVISAFVGNLTISFSVFFAFLVRKKIAGWFIPKILKTEVGDQNIRRQILLDNIIAQFVLNTSFFVFAIFNNFSANALELSGIYANYFLVKTAVVTFLSVVVNVPSNSYARIHHQGNDVNSLFAFKIYDYLGLVIAMVAMFLVLFGSPFVTSLVTSKDVVSGPDSSNLSVNAFNFWISLMVALSCFIDISRIPCENYKSIIGEYKWKIKYASIEAGINILISVITAIIAYYYPNLLNGLFLVFGLILAIVLSTGFRLVAIKISVWKSLSSNKKMLVWSYLRIFAYELFPILLTSIMCTLTLHLLMKNQQIVLHLNANTILLLFYVGLVALGVIFINTCVFIGLNNSFRSFLLTKAKDLIKNRSKK